jgi:hypothetical protein
MVLHDLLQGQLYLTNAGKPTNHVQSLKLYAMLQWNKARQA